MAGAETEAEDGSEDGGGGGGCSDRARPGRSGSAARVAPLGPEQLRRVLELVAKAQVPAGPPPPFVLQDAVRRLRDAAQQAALQRGFGAEPSRPPRLLPPQQLEAICVKVTSEGVKDQESPLPQLTTFQPRTPRLSQPPRRHCSVLGLSITSPQLLRARPLLSSEPQLSFLSNSPQSPVQVFVQRPLSTIQLVPAERLVAPQAPDGPGATLAPQSTPDPPARTSVSSSSANLLISNLHTKHTEKLKKSLKVKTRSGRISRPPKYKAKDYKFIKMEDLADSHLSDSDDYSELSVEEDEEQRGKQALFDLPSCSLRPKTFKCQACEKSYIGRGGLARHFKLNPGHGQPEPEMFLSEKTSGSMIPGCAEGRTIGLTSLGLSTPALLSDEGARSAQGGMQEGQSIQFEEVLVSEPEDGSYGPRLGSERHLDPKKGYSTAPAEPSVLEQGRPARSRARLKEFLHQCDREDLVELALPQLAQVVTVYEFLLMKVEKGHLAKPFFPAVYKEFEELHKMVKKMCHDYLCRSGPCSQEPLEINSNEVAESLGITEFLRKRETHTDGIPHTHTIREAGGEELEAARVRKRVHEAAEEGLTSAKRTRRAALLEEPSEPAASRGQQEPARRAPTDGEGFACRVNGNACHCPEEGHTMLISESDVSTSQAGQQLKALADLAARSGSADPALLYRDVCRPGLYSQTGQPGMRTLQQEVEFPTEDVQGQTSDLTAGDSPGSQGFCCSSTSKGGVSSLLPGATGNSKEGELCSGPGSRGSSPQSRPWEALHSGPAATPLQRVLSVHATPMHCAYSTVSKPGPHLGGVGSLFTQGGLGNHAEDLGQFPCGTGTPTDQTELESIVAVGEAMAFEINGCQEMLSQAPEQILTQTSNGLTLPAPGSMVSGKEEIVILAETEGPVLQTGPPEGVPLGTVEACPSQ